MQDLCSFANKELGGQTNENKIDEIVNSILIKNEKEINDFFNFEPTYCNLKCNKEIYFENTKTETENAFFDLDLLIKNSLGLTDQLNRIVAVFDKYILTSDNHMLASIEKAEEFKKNVSGYQQNITNLINESEKLKGGYYQNELKNAILHPSILIELLATKKIDPNFIFDDGATVLTYAIAKKQNDAAAILISAGADLYKLDGKGNSPLVVAFISNNDEIIKNVLNNPNIEIKKELKNEALKVAASFGKVEVLKMLIAIGADAWVDALFASALQGHEECVELILKQGVNPNIAAVDGNTALHLAASAGHDNVVTKLIQFKADPLQLTSDGLSALEVAVLHNKMGVCQVIFEEIQLHLDHLSPEVKQRIVMSLAKVGMDNELESVLVKFPDVNFTDQNKITPLMAAIQNGHLNVAKVLLKYEAKVAGVFDLYGQDPLIKAALAGSAALIYNLIEKGGDLFHRDVYGLTAFEYLLLKEQLKPSLAVHRLLLAFPQAINESLLHFNLVESIGGNFQMNGKHFDALLLKLKECNSENLRKRFHAPIEDSVRKSAQALHEELRLKKFDVEELSRNDDSAYNKLLQGRMGGSMSINAQDNLNLREEAANDWKKADVFIRKLANAKEPLTQKHLCELNGFLNLKNRGGELRDVEISTAELGLTFYIPLDEVKAEVERFTTWLNEKMEDCVQGHENPIVVAARAYQWLVSIHPFNDANGRTCRLIMDYVLQRFNLPPSNLMQNIYVAIFPLIPGGSTPSQAVTLVEAGLKNSSSLFSDQ